MRLIHTADWHLGRRLKGIDRTPEIANALEALLKDVEALGADAVLIAGDIFETPSPPAEAERVAYRFFKRLAELGVPAVAIAGNHDSASRMDGVASLLALAGVKALGKPRRADSGGLVALETASGMLRVGALPFASERRLLAAEDLWNLDDQTQRQHYREAVDFLMHDLAGGFDHRHVNVLMAHVAMGSAKLAHSEAPFYTRDTYALEEACLPGDAQYIALGHIHTPQRIEAAAPTHYSGSLIQVDFGECDEAKGFNVIDVEPGRPAKVRFQELPTERPLKTLDCNADTLDDTLERHRDHAGYLKVVVRLETPLVGLADRVRKICPQALQIEPRYPQARVPDGEGGVDPTALSPVEAFARYYETRLGSKPRADVTRAFEALYEEMIVETA